MHILRLGGNLHCKLFFSSIFFYYSISLSKMLSEKNNKNKRSLIGAVSKKGFALKYMIDFTDLCNHHNQIQCIFITKNKSHNYEQSSPIFLLSFQTPQATGNLFSLSTDQPILGILYKYKNTTYVLLWMASFTMHNIFKIHCSMNRYFIFLLLNNITLYVHAIFYLSIHLIGGCTLGLLLLFWLL